MKSMQICATLLLTLLFLNPLAAEESDPAQKCDMAFEACQEKCEKAEDGSEKCYEVCENTYDECLSLAQQD